MSTSTALRAHPAGLADALGRAPCRRVCLVATLLSSLALAGGDALAEVGSETQSIMGGSLEVGYPAVVFLVTSTGACTGSLIADTVVLTAAHCIEDSLPDDIRGTVSFGTGVGEFFATRSVVDMAMHRYYGANFQLGYDIAMVRLDSPAPAEVAPVELNTQALDGTYVGAEVRSVGFGGTGYVDGQLQGVGTKRSALITVDDVSPLFVVIGNDMVNTCQGDSGGPHFMQLGGNEVQVAVTSFGPEGCLGWTKASRVDTYHDDFIVPIQDAWSGPCQQDGTCVTEGCRTPDPDCDQNLCGFDGFCGEGCVELDLDCPVAGLPGDLCTDDLDCDTRRCVPADDDPRVSYCTQVCDPEASKFNYGCERPLNTCEPAGDIHLCGFGGPTPSTQGAPCESGADCRSGMCDTAAAICVEPCGEGASCGEGFECRGLDGVDVCTIPGDGGGCALAPGGGNGRSALANLALILLALAAVLGWRRRSGHASLD